MLNMYDIFKYMSCLHEQLLYNNALYSYKHANNYSPLCATKTAIKIFEFDNHLSLTAHAYRSYNPPTKPQSYNSFPMTTLHISVSYDLAGQLHHARVLTRVSNQQLKQTIENARDRHC